MTRNHNGPGRGGGEKTVHINELSNIKMTTGGEARHPIVILDGLLKEWVGIGWVGDRPPTEEEWAKYPVVVRSTRRERAVARKQAKAAKA